MTTFKAVDGFTNNAELKDLGRGLNALVSAEPNPAHDESYPDPCTIIPGHWAAKIESGELLTEEEYEQMWNEWANTAETNITMWLQRFIARKLRGEA